MKFANAQANDAVGDRKEDLVEMSSPEGHKNAPLWRTSIHECDHVVTDLLLGLEVAGTTIVPGPGYERWGPQATRARRGKAAHDEAGDDTCETTALQVAQKISLHMPAPGEARHNASDIFRV